MVCLPVNKVGNWIERERVTEWSGCLTRGVWAQHVPHKWYHSRLEIFYISVPQPRAFQPRHPSCEVKQLNIFAYWCEIYCQAAQKIFEFPSCWKYLEVKNICSVQCPGTGYHVTSSDSSPHISLNRQLSWRAVTSPAPAIVLHGLSCKL